MPSYAGQDTGYIPAKAKTMIFIPSKGGSHNPKESTKKEFIETATRVFTDLSRTLLLEKFRDTKVVHNMPQLNIADIRSKHLLDNAINQNIFRDL